MATLPTLLTLVAKASMTAYEAPTALPLPASLAYLQPAVYEDMVRIGSFCDGGYLVPRACLVDIDALLSFGISVDWQFEKQIRQLKPLIPIHAYDHTVGAQLFVKHLLAGLLSPSPQRGRLGELCARVAVWRDYREFFVRHAVHHRQRVHNRHDTPKDATLDDILARVGDCRHLLIKCDIEGGEYRIIPDMLRHVDRIDVIVLELHDTDPLRPVFELQMRALAAHFVLAHLHGNNYCGQATDGLPDALEATFVSKRFGLPARWRTTLPLAGLDSRCNPTMPEIALRFAERVA